jgi:hypothetical protein
MQRRQITLEDGRYLIFYTFDDERAAASAEEAAGDETASARPEDAHAEPQATEEKRV